MFDNLDDLLLLVSTSGDVQYIGGIPWCMWGDIMIHVGDIMSTSGDFNKVLSISFPT